ncbi:hypothetical protein ACRBEV_24890 [Methylobacterium phyllosphaerae]
MAGNLAEQVPGPAALTSVADDETGELQGVTILGQWSGVPAAAEGLRGV